MLNMVLPKITSIKGFSNERLERLNKLQEFICARPTVTREEILEALYLNTDEFPWKPKGRLSRDLFALRQFYANKDNGTELIHTTTNNRNHSYALQHAAQEAEKIVQEAQRIAEITGQFDMSELNMPRFQVGDCAYAPHERGMAKYIVFGVAPVLTQESTAKGIFKQWRYLTALHPDFCKYVGDYKCDGFFETLGSPPVEEDGKANPSTWWQNDDNLFHTREELIEWIKTQNY